MGENTSVDINNLKMSILDENFAVETYEKMRDASDNQKVKDLFNHIIEEEKKHAQEFKELLDEIS